MEVTFFGIPEVTAEQAQFPLTRDLLQQEMAKLNFQLIGDAYPIIVWMDNVEREAQEAIDNYIAKVKRCSESYRAVNDLLDRFRQQYPELYLQYNAAVKNNPPSMFAKDLTMVSIGRIVGEGLRGRAFSGQTKGMLDVNATILDAFGLSTNVPLIIKITPIVDVELWAVHHELANATEKVIAAPRKTYNRYAELFRAMNIKRVDFVSLVQKGDLELVDAVLQQEIDRQYEHPLNSAYVDVVGTYLGSELVSQFLSPFHPLLYGSARVYTTTYFPNDIYDEEPIPGINDRFPVELMFMQRLDGSMGDLIAQDFFGKYLEDNQRIRSMLAQVVFGLHIINSVYGFVHNDLHMANLLFENVSQNHYLYYCYRPKNNGQYRYYAVPTLGKVYKLIDNDNAQYNILGGGNVILPINYPHWKRQTQQGDLLKLFTSILLADEKTHYARYMQGEHNLLFDVIRQAATCQDLRASRATTINLLEKQTEECIPELEAEDRMDCFRRSLQFPMYFDYFRCDNALPATMFGLFDDYIVERDTIPSTAIIYPLLD